MALNHVLKQSIMDELNAPPTLDEIKKAISLLNTNRASGKDGIPDEIYKAASSNTLESFHHILNSIWDEEEMPEDFHDLLIVATYKNKSTKADCGNYSGISLLSIVGKIFVHVILNRLITVSEKCLPEAQCGIRPGCSSTDVIFVIKHVQEKMH